ncbi:MAG: indolepyruvate ferredoxin oxidoreductase subunit alpha [Oscillospiraceae bacterium]|nr:indolepyruvate ferredoxin oxidoreductase subunit alpha [Oscillospiraceae bacterium]
MKQLMLGNEAVARGLFEAGVKVVSSYPGTPSTEITEYAAKYNEIYCEWAPNEKVAAEVAFGASLRGVRSACAMKHVGLNVAADPLFTLAYTGVTGGMVMFVADDPAMHSSQNEQDSRHYAIAAKVPMIEPADSMEAKEFVKEAYRISEEYDTPVLFRMCTRIAHSQSTVELCDREEKELLPYEKNPQKYIMAPANAIRRHPFVETRTNLLKEFGERTSLNRVEMGGTEKGIICSGTCYQYVKEVFGDSVSVLKLGLVNPLPEKIIRDFAEKVDTLYVIEELDGIIETHLNTLNIPCIGKEMFSPIGEFSQASIRQAFNMEKPITVTADSEIPVRPPIMCAGCPHRGLFYVLAKNKITVLGDIGCYTLGSAPPLCALDSTLCMGASVSGIHGFNKAGGADSEKKTVCVIGDSTFMHSGMTGLVNISYNASNSTVIILDNSITGMTGHQQNPTTGYNIKGEAAAKVNLEELCHAIGISRVRVVDPYNLKECEDAILEETATEEPSVIISRRPCMLLKYVKAKPPVEVNKDKCVGCKMCMKIGCPAISIKDKKAQIDFTQCVGCDVCTQMCKLGAISRRDD